MKKVLLTGSEGFIGGYLVKELIKKGYYVVGIDNLSKYGKIIRNHSESKNYEFIEGDVKDKDLLKNTTLFSLFNLKQSIATSVVVDIIFSFSERRSYSNS